MRSYIPIGRLFGVQPRKGISPLVGPALALVGLLFAPVSADYLNASLTTGGYFLQNEDAEKKGPFYQHQMLGLHGASNDFSYAVSYRYTDFFDKRPNSYETHHLLGMAFAKYQTPVKGLSVTAGRSFHNLFPGNLSVDGGILQYARMGSAEMALFGGYTVPSFYDPNLFNPANENRVAGWKGRLFLPGRMQLLSDGAFFWESEAVSTGLGLRKRFLGNIDLEASAVFKSDSMAISKADLHMRWKPRRDDILLLRAGIEDEMADSSRLYEFFVQQPHSHLYGSYLLTMAPWLRFDAGIGLVLYETVTAIEWNLGAQIAGSRLQFQHRLEEAVRALDMSASYAKTYWERFTPNFGVGYILYDLSMGKTDLNAFYTLSGASWEMVDRLQLGGQYEFLRNRVYKYDHRVSVRLKYNYSASWQR